MMVLDQTNKKKDNNELLNEYRTKLEIEMIKLGANEHDISLIKDATIRNALRRNRKPEDVAWALLQ